MPAAPKPVVTGFGPLLLDVGLSGEAAYARAGGGCTNVLVILASLGWEAHLLGEIANDDAGHAVLDDLVRWQVITGGILRTATRTPVLLQRTTNGFHRYSWKCQNCGADFARPQPLPVEEAARLLNNMARADVFFTDVANAASLVMAKRMRAEGALIFFEPFAVGDDAALAGLAEISDVVKYSGEREPALRAHLHAQSARLIVETQGEAGLRFRLPFHENSGWRSQPPVTPLRFVDSSGAGDWASAVLIDRLMRGGRVQLAGTPLAVIEAALAEAQQIAAWSCGFAGARGGMYSETSTKQNVPLPAQASRPPRHFGVEGDCPAGLRNAAERYCSNCRG